MTKYKRKRDGNHAEVVQALRAAGYQVTDYASLGHVLDLVVSHNNGEFRCWVEIKLPGEKMTPAEREFCKCAPGFKVLVYGGQNAVDTLALVRKFERHYDAHSVLGEMT